MDTDGATDRAGRARPWTAWVKCAPGRTTGRRTVRRALSAARAASTARRWLCAGRGRRFARATTSRSSAATSPASGWPSSCPNGPTCGSPYLDRGLIGERWPSGARVPVSEVAAPPSMAPLVRRSVAHLADSPPARPPAVGRASTSSRWAAPSGDLRALAARVAACRRHAGSTLSGGMRPQALEIIGHHLDPLCAAGAVLEAGARVADVKVLPWVLGGLAAGRGVDIVERCAVQRIETGGRRVGACHPRAGRRLRPPSSIPPRARSCSWWRRCRTAASGIAGRRCSPSRCSRSCVPLSTAAGEVSQTDEGEVQLSGRSGGALSQTDRFPLAGAATLAAGASDALPALARLRLVAHWQRTDLLAPDGLPVAGASGEDGLLRIGGFGGHHIALAPAVAEGVARQLLRQPARLSLEALAPNRLGGSSRQLDVSDPGSDANREVSPM